MDIPTITTIHENGLNNDRQRKLYKRYKTKYAQIVADTMFGYYMGSTNGVLFEAIRPYVTVNTQDELKAMCTAFAVIRDELKEFMHDQFGARVWRRTPK